MRATSYHHHQSLADLKRLVALPDIAPYLGDIILRRSLRITIFVAFASLLGWSANLLGMDGPSLKQAATMTFYISLGSTGVGLLLKFSPVFIKKARNIAEASQINLMEDLKKAHANEHLNILWDRVYSHEAAQVSSPQKIEKELCIISHYTRALDSARKTLQEEFSSDILTLFPNLHHPELRLKNPLTKEGFRRTARHLVSRPLPQARSYELTGLRLGDYANYLDGAPFHLTDSKLIEDGEHNQVIFTIKQDLYRLRFFPLICWGHSFRERYIRLPQKIWFPLCMRAISSRLGSSISELNHRFQTHSFDAQHFLWPGTENQSWILKLEGAQEALLNKRKEVIHSIFSLDFSRAQVILDRMHMPGFEIATELRRKYDPDYCAGRLPQTLKSDLSSMGCSEHYIRWQLSLNDKRYAKLAGFETFIQEKYPTVAQSPKFRRAASIAFLCKKQSLHRYQREHAKGRLENTLNTLHRKEALYSSSLISLRVHQSLCMISRNDYLALLKELAYY